MSGGGGQRIEAKQKGRKQELTRRGLDFPSSVKPHGSPACRIILYRMFSIYMNIKKRLIKIMKGTIW